MPLKTTAVFSRNEMSVPRVRKSSTAVLTSGIALRARRNK
jgi:hypothetical protein